MGVPVDGVQAGASFAAGTPTTLVPGTGYFTRIANQLGRTYDVTPDSKRFLRIKVAANASSNDTEPSAFVVVQSWTEELKRLVPTTN